MSRDTFDEDNTTQNSYKLSKSEKDGCTKMVSKGSDLKGHKGKENDEEYLPPENKKQRLGQDNEKKLYKCDEEDCSAQFKESEQLQKHKLLRHWGQRIYKCDHDGCEKSYKNNCHLQRHITSSHSSITDTSEPVTCEVSGCGKTYCNKYVLKQHITSVHQDHPDNNGKKPSDTEKRHKCDEPGCNAAFNRPYRLKNHKLAAHAGQAAFKCDHKGCDKSYTNESHLARHKKLSHKPVDIDTTAEVICGVEGCGRIFFNKFNLKKHVSTIHKELPFACQTCNSKFKRKSHLHAHKVEVHGENTPYECPHCNLAFVHYHAYNKHIRSHKTYDCDCEKTFEKWSEMIKHKKTCTVKKEYKCVICAKTFTQKQALTRHSLLVHIPDSQVEVFKCPYLNCKYSYKYKYNLKHHITTIHNKIFDRIQCPEKGCNLILKSKRYLKNHLRTVHRGLQEKIRKPRKPRKDKGKPKKCMPMACKISGMKFESNSIADRTMIISDIVVNCDKTTEAQVVSVSPDNVTVHRTSESNKKAVNEVASHPDVSDDDSEEIEQNSENKLINNESNLIQVPPTDHETIFLNEKTHENDLLGSIPNNVTGHRTSESNKEAVNVVSTHTDVTDDTENIYQGSKMELQDNKTNNSDNVTVQENTESMRNGTTEMEILRGDNMTESTGKISFIQNSEVMEQNTENKSINDESGFIQVSLDNEDIVIEKTNDNGMLCKSPDVISSSQNSCDSGVFISDFPELENAKRCSSKKNMEAKQ